MFRQTLKAMVLIGLLATSACTMCRRTLSSPCRGRYEPATLIDRLVTGNAWMRRRAAELLRTDMGVPEEAIQPLVVAMRKESDAEAHGAMLVTLGRAGVAEALPHIDATFRTRDPRARRYAADALWAWRYANGLEADAERPPGWPYPPGYRRP